MVTLEKQPSESRQYTLDFTAFPEMKRGDVITNIQEVTYEVVSGTEETALTLDNGVINTDGDKVQVQIGDGTHEVLYKVTAVVDTNAGDVLEGEGFLFVFDY
ncbi:phage fiber-tail adaptor protein [Thiohalorhabdus sp.]|uniref:phage fiber-tail adaptor protein n=1 Tax=Thiohalorhabdus sp. TaxID=3094134 RepID=UPI002FC2E5DC